MRFGQVPTPRADRGTSAPGGGGWGGKGKVLPWNRHGIAIAISTAYRYQHEGIFWEKAGSENSRARRKDLTKARSLLGN